MKRNIVRSRVIAAFMVAVLFLPLAATVICSQVRDRDMAEMRMGTEQAIAHSQNVLSATATTVGCITLITCTTSAAFVVQQARLDTSGAVFSTVSSISGTAAVSFAAAPTPPPPRA